jgi:hypothetical protein
MAASTLPAFTAAAQPYNQPPPDYNNGPPPDYNNGPPPDYNNNGAPPDYRNGPPPDAYGDQPPSGYNDSNPPPPPPGYDAGARTPDQRAQDERYEAYAERWAQDNCVRSRGDPAAGALIGGIFGALIGAGVGGHHGAFAGAAIGGTTGAVIASGAGGDETSPGCPPGYVVRGGAEGFDYDTQIYYAAPTWYHPWVWWDDRWVYRPYPYHTWYYEHYSHRDRDDWRDHRDHDHGDWR